MTTTKDKSIQEILTGLAASHGGLTPELVLNEARPKESPLHKHFCWDDTEAAEKYRELQAASLIRKIKVSYITPENKTIVVRAFLNVQPELTQGVSDQDELETKRGLYLPMQEAMTDYRSQLLDQCKADCAAFRRKYAALHEVANILAAMQPFEEAI